MTTWSRFDNHWRGVRFKTLAELVVPNDDASHVLCTGYDHMPGTSIPYTTNLPLARAVEDDVLLVHTWQGEPLPREHGGPVRMITPKLYAWKGTKWIRKIEFLARDQKGFWEVRGYSNSAEPWFNDDGIRENADYDQALRRDRLCREVSNHQRSPTSRNRGSLRNSGGLPSTAWPTNCSTQPRTNSVVGTGQKPSTNQATTNSASDTAMSGMPKV